MISEGSGDVPWWGLLDKVGIDLRLFHCLDLMASPRQRQMALAVGR